MEKKTETVATFDFEIRIISWEQYFNCIVRERAYNTVEEYNMQTKFPEFNFNGTEESDGDTTYEHKFRVVEELKDPSSDVKRQFVEQLDEHVGKPTKSTDSMEECVELAVLSAIERFVNVDNCVVVDMGDGEFVLAPTTRDDLVLKLLSPIDGALVIYRPLMFIRFKV
jgi:hypothetical protein